MSGRNDLSRRTLFYAGARIGCAAILGASALAASARAQAAKATQAQAGYQATPNNGQTCAGCTYFQPANSCSVVEGQISPNGWCKLYQKKA